MGDGYEAALDEIIDLIASARRSSARSVNAIMTATYWMIGRRIIHEEQRGKRRARYGEELIERLSADLGRRMGRGFSQANLRHMRAFFVTYAPIRQTVSGELGALASSFPLPWSHYVRLLAVRNERARHFYEREALRGGWTIRQLQRQIGSLFYERTALSRNKAAMLQKGQRQEPSDVVTPEQEIKDPFVLEFLDLKDEYSELEVEEALVRDLESFLLEMGNDFAFVGRQRRLRIGDQWFRVDLLFFHRRLRCLVIIDLKLTEFSHADAGQMHMYLNYAREHWTLDGENAPVGLILCAGRNEAVARYALEGLPNKIVAAEYMTALPDERLLVEHVERTRETLERRKARKPRGARESAMVRWISGHETAASVHMHPVH